MVHGKNRIPYWIDRSLTGLAGPDYDATISVGLPIEPENSQYGESRLNGPRSPVDKRAIGGGLLVSTAIAVFVLIMVAVVMAEDNLGPERLTRWHYAASWINGVLGFYAWTAFWLGLRLRLVTRDRFAHILVLVVMTIGIVIFAVSGLDEITN